MTKNKAYFVEKYFINTTTSAHPRSDQVNNPQEKHLVSKNYKVGVLKEFLLNIHSCNHPAKTSIGLFNIIYRYISHVN
jgi:hypothetical protein